MIRKFDGKPFMLTQKRQDAVDQAPNSAIKDAVSRRLKQGDGFRMPDGHAMEEYPIELFAAGALKLPHQHTVLRFWRDGDDFDARAICER